TGGATYYVEVLARDPNGANNTGQYFLGADFNPSVVAAPDLVGGGQLGPFTTTNTGTLSIDQGGIFQLVLGSATLGTGTGAVTLTVTDSSGRVICTLDATAGQPAMTTVR